MRRRLGPLTIDLDRRELLRDGAPIDVQPKVFDLVALLCAEPQRIFGKDELLAALWPDVRVTEASLHQAMRKARRALGDDPDAPTFIEAVSRRGWRWIGPSRPVADPVPGFFGRDELLAELDLRMTPGARVVLHGPGGVGKTRLASEWPAATVRVSLSEAASPADVVRRLAHALAVPLEGAVDPFRAVGAALAGAVVVLDQADATAAWLGACLDRIGSDAAWLVASRNEVPGATTTLTVGGLAPGPALALLRFLAPRHEHDEALEAVLAPLDGVPLAIELAAARLDLMPPRALAARLSASLQVLSTARWWSSVADAAAERSEAERAVLGAAAVFPHRFDAEGLEFVSAPVPALDALSQLLGASLVRREGDGFTLQPLIREYASAELSPPGAADRWSSRVASQVEAALPGATRWEPAALHALRDALEDLVVAERRCPDGDPRGETFAAGIAFACRYGGPWDLAFDALRRRARDLGAARVLAQEYAVRCGAPDPDGLRACVDTVGDPVLRGHAAYLLARVRTAAGDLDGALAAAELAEGSGDDAVAALGLDARATVELRRGEGERALTTYDRALGRVQSDRTRIVRAIVASNHASTLARLGRLDAAIPRLRIAVDAATDLQLGSAARANLAAALLERGGQAEAATPLLEHGLALARRLGDRSVAATQASWLALACAITGDGARADALLDEAEHLRPDPANHARLAVRRTWAALARGDADSVRTRLASAVALASTDVERTHAAFFAAGVARRLGDPLDLGPARALAERHDPDLLPWLDAWARGHDLPDDPLATAMPVDVWALYRPLDG